VPPSVVVRTGRDLRAIWRPEAVVRALIQYEGAVRQRASGWSGTATTDLPWWLGDARVRPSPDAPVRGDDHMEVPDSRHSVAVMEAVLKHLGLVGSQVEVFLSATRAKITCGTLYGDHKGERQTL